MSVAAMAACTGRQDKMVDTALDLAATNRAEIERVLSCYAPGSDTAGIARSLVAAMPGLSATTGAGMDSIEAMYRQLPVNGSWGFDSARTARGRMFAAMPLTTEPDLRSITAKYLIDNIDDAYSLWRSRKWNADLPPELFCEMLLPYRIGNEPVTSWRGAYRRWLADIEDSIAPLTNAVDAARIVSARIGSCPYNDRLSTPHRSALALLDYPVGYCREDCDRTAYAMRALGIPVAVDMMLASPENGAAHMWNVVYDNDAGHTRMFDNRRYLPTRDSIHNDLRRKGKVYRLTFAPTFGRLQKYQGAKSAPPALLNPRLADVTAQYFGHNTAEVAVDPGVGEVYLGIYTPGGFKAVDIAERRGDKAVFTDIEPCLIFFPVTNRGASFEACGPPFMLAEHGRVHTFGAQSGVTERVRLTRKFPLRFIHKERLASIVGVQVQSAPTAAGPWRTIHVVERPAWSNYYPVPLATPLTDRYIRLYQSGEGSALLSELIAARDSLGLHTMPLTIAGTTDAKRRYATLADRNILTAGALMPRAEDLVYHNPGGAVPHLFIVPANDDNFVMPAQTYALYYFADNEWRHIATKTSNGFDIEFDAPAGAVLLLRNLSKGREEQIFVWSGNRQLFNIDLPAPALIAH